MEKIHLKFMKKRILCTMLVAVLVLSITGCSTKKTENKEDSSTETTESTVSGNDNMKAVDADGNIQFEISGLADAVKLGEYKNVYPSEKKSLEPNEEEIQDGLNYYLTMYSDEMTHVDKAAELDDTINVTYTVLVDGEELEATTENITLGYNMINEGVDAQLVGLSAGDEKEIETTYSEEYFDEQLRGKSATIKLKVNWVGGEKLPATYTDDFVNTMTGGAYKTTAEFDEFVKNEITQTKKQEVFTNAWTIIVENAEVGDISAVVEKECQEQLDSIAEAIKQYGMTQEDYWNMYGGVDNEEDFNALIKEQTERHVKERAIVYKLAEENNIVVTEEECLKELETTAQNAGYASVEEFIATNGNDYVADSLIYDKVMDFVVDCQMTN